MEKKCDSCHRGVNQNYATVYSPTGKQFYLCSRCYKQLILDNMNEKENEDHG